jgi:hypothetical protein
MDKDIVNYQLKFWNYRNESIFNPLNLSKNKTLFEIEDFQSIQFFDISSLWRYEFLSIYYFLFSKLFLKKY